jgi:hypothetical protein
MFISQAGCTALKMYNRTSVTVQEPMLLKLLETECSTEDRTQFLQFATGRLALSGQDLDMHTSCERLFTRAFA